MTELERERLDRIIRHMDRVRGDCTILGESLIKDGEDDLGRKLIANGYNHDNSKLSGIEWLYLHDDVKESNPNTFVLAVNQHQQNNPHHPEYWGKIDEMPRLYIAEMVCDWKARTNEFGTDLREWIKDKATKKFEFTTSGRVYKEIKEFCDLLLEVPFK